jgi:hypothetical protein
MALRSVCGMHDDAGLLLEQPPGGGRRAIGSCDPIRVSTARVQPRK